MNVDPEQAVRIIKELSRKEVRQFIVNGEPVVIMSDSQAAIDELLAFVRRGIIKA